MSKEDKKNDETNDISDTEEESPNQKNRTKKDTYYVVSSDRFGKIITQFNWRKVHKGQSHIYIEWAKVVRLTLHSKKKLRFIDWTILIPENDPKKEDKW